MLILAATTDKLQLITDAAVTVDVHASFADYSAGAVTPGKQNTAISTAITTDILASPAGSTYRKLKFCSARNRHASASVTVTFQYNQNASLFEIHKTRLNPGECLEYVEGIGFFLLAATTALDLRKALTADATGADSATAQAWFPSGGAVAVEAATVYEFYGFLHLTRAAGGTSHTTGLGFAGTATLTAFGAEYWCGTGDVATIAADNCAVAVSAADLNVKAASTAPTEVIKAAVQGSVLINAAGTFIPQFKYSAAPGGAPTIKAGTFFHLTKVAPNPAGTWT